MLVKMPELTDLQVKCHTIKHNIAPGAPCTMHSTANIRYIFFFKINISTSIFMFLKNAENLRKYRDKQEK